MQASTNYKVATTFEGDKTRTFGVRGKGMLEKETLGIFAKKHSTKGKLVHHWSRLVKKKSRISDAGCGITNY